MMYACCDRRRRDLVANDGSLLNGIDYLEVLDHGAPPGMAPQQTLLVRCLKDITPGLTAANVRLSGGEAGHQVHVVWAATASAVPAAAGVAEQAFFAALPKPDGLLVVRTDVRGDFSTYSLTLVTSPTDENPPQNLDPQLVSVEFSFKVECPSDFDCQPVTACPPAAAPAWNPDYLAKDYASFRRLLLDRLANLLPEWREPTAADEVVALTELFAYVGDRLSYQQDAIATEAYIGTARRRISLRRHALLVDYHMHDGCNARAWVIVQLAPGGAADGAILAKDATQFLTRVPGGAPPTVDPTSQDLTKALMQRPVVFEPMHALTLREDHVLLSLYTWDDERCCLPVGATAATLHGHFPLLEVGQVLVFEEVKGPLTGAPADADPAHRHAVRLTFVNFTQPGGGDLVDPRNQEKITEIGWGEEDALQFPLCLSSLADQAHGGSLIQDVSVARGNVVLVDHGRTVRGEPLGTVPAPVRYSAAPPGDPCKPATPTPILPRFRPRPALEPLTQAAPLDTRSARASINQAMTGVLPSIELAGTLEGVTEPWGPLRDLLRSAGTERAFVVETEYDGSALLRFGDDVHGLRPPAGTSFAATYRIGTGRAGNVGAESIYHVVTAVAGIAGARNPLPACGGVEPETAEAVRRRAPEAFRTLERAVTPADYAYVTQHFNDTDIQRAVAQLRWTGSWHTVFITPDPMAGHTPNVTQVRRVVDRFRMAGHDLEFDTPRWVSLDIAMLVCVRNEYFRSQVKQALLDVFSAGRRTDGQLGMFHPDRFSFGQPVYTSPLYAAARAVPGVASVEITTFQRQGIDTKEYLDAGRLTLGPLEIARLENDRSQPEHGILTLDLRGGK